MPRVITGSLNSQNKGAIEWGCYDYVAYGSQTFVVVVNVSNASYVQTLEGHKFSVTKIRWPRENFPHDDRNLVSDNSRQLRLASADTSGQIIVWDVFGATKIATMFEESCKSLSEMFWLPWRDASNDLLLALHANPSILILWNAEQSTKIWKKAYFDTPLYTFCLDPFQYNNAAFISQHGILMLADDLSFSKPPATCNRQFSISSPSNFSAEDNAAKRASTVSSSTSLASAFVKTPLIKVLAATVATAADRSGKLLEGGVGPDGGSPGEAGSPFSAVNSSPIFDDSFLQLTYHPAVRNLLLLAYTRAIIILNSSDAQMITQIVFDRTASPLQQILPATMRDAIYFVQENGAVSLRLQKYKKFISSNHDSQDAAIEAVYDLLCTSESLRVTKINRVMGCTLCPITQRRFSLLLSTGKLIFYELSPTEMNKNAQNHQNLSISDDSGPFPTPDLSNLYQKTFLVLSDLVKISAELDQNPVGKLFVSNSATMDFLGAGATVMRVCPKPNGPGKQLVAVGTADGSIQTVDMQSGEIERDLSVHSCAIKCMEWVSSYRLVTSAYSQPLSNSNFVRNELYLTDIRTGFSKILRKSDDSEDESQIELLRVSHFGCFLAVGFRDQPLEIWDLRAFRLLRRMARSCPIIVDIAWSSKHHNQSQISSTNNNEEQEKTGDTNKNKESGGHMIYRENLVILDNENHLYHVVVKGVHVRDGKEVNTQWLNSTVVTTMAWKGEILIFGYADGRISVWNLETKQSKASASVLSQRGAVKRICFSKQPSDFTFLALHTDGVSVWNALTFTCISQLQAPSKEKPFRILDADLAGDENTPVLLTTDGCIRVYDNSLTNLNQNVDNSANLLCFPLLPKVISTLIKIVLLDRQVLDCYCSETVKSDLNLSNSAPAAFKDALLNLIRQHLDIKESDKNLLIRYFSNLNDNTLNDIIPRDWFLPLGSCDQEKKDKCPHWLAVRASTIDRLLGNEWGANYWSLVEGLLRNQCPDSTPANFDMFWDNKSFYKLQVKRISTFNPKRCSPDQLKSYVESLILLGHFETAARVLLDGENARADYYANCLKACVLSGAAAAQGAQSFSQESQLSAQSPQLSAPEAQLSAQTCNQSTTTLKMAATNLIADGKLNEGVELLKIGGKNLDACRYLQSFGRWEQSTWLAKVSFDDNDEEWREIMKRWVDALCSPQISKKTMATLLLLSMRQWEKVLELLLNLKQARLAVLTAHCFDIGLDQSENVSNNIGHVTTTNKILENVYGQYARLLFDVGLKKAAFFYSEKSGDMAKNLTEEFKLLSSE